MIFVIPDRIVGSFLMNSQCILLNLDKDVGDLDGFG